MTHPFERLLLATEHSEFDSGAEALAFALAQRCGLPLGGVLPIVGNAEYEMVAPDHAARADALAAERRSALEAAARAHGVALDLRVRHGPELDAEIVAEARDRKADLIVIRRRGRRGLLANLLVGEMVGKVVAQAPCSVLVTPRGAAMWQRRVMLAVDPLAPDRGSVTRAAAIAAECGLPLHLTCVAADAAVRAAAEQALAQALAIARAAHAASDGDVRVGRAPDVLIEAARDAGADLLVIARHAGAAQKVVGRADCPVLIHVDPSMQGAT
jgi:nucleotide-binding universal stress UspA family protein